MRVLLIAAAAALFLGVAFAATPPIPDTMLAAAIDRGGGPEVLTPHRLPVPRADAGQLLIAVHSAGVGVWEIKHRQNPAGIRFPHILGNDGAGTVVAIGSGVRGFKLGDKVYGVGSAMFGEYAAVPAEHFAHIPQGVGFVEAGILGISGLSALQGVDDVLRLKPGETVIIHGASGGVGTLAVQFAKLRGVKVLATASSDEGMALVSRLGADVVVNGRTGGIAAAARKFSPDGVDAVLGLVGGEALESCIDTLRRDGRGRVAFMYGMQYDASLPRPRVGVRMTLYTVVSGTQELKQLNKAAEAARVEVPIAAEYSLADAADAHRRLEAGGLMGKIVLRIN